PCLTHLFGYNGPGNDTSDEEFTFGGGVALAGNQLIANDKYRLLFWNDRTSLTDGQTPSGIITPTNETIRIKASHSHLYVTNGRSTNNPGPIDVYDLPLTNGATPHSTINFPLSILGDPNHTIDLGYMGQSSAFWGVEPTDDDSFLWLAQSNSHRA